MNHLQQKAVAVMAIAPVIADYLEDLEQTGLFDGEMIRLSKMFKAAIRRNDTRIIDRGKYSVDKTTVIKEQESLQFQFRQSVKELKFEK